MNADFECEETIALLREATPFDGSFYELSAIAVYENGLHCVGERVYWSLDDAIADWRKDYDADMADTARGLSKDRRITAGNEWLPTLFSWARPDPQIKQVET